MPERASSVAGRPPVRWWLAATVVAHDCLRGSHVYAGTPGDLTFGMQICICIRDDKA